MRILSAILLLCSSTLMAMDSIPTIKSQLEHMRSLKGYSPEQDEANKLLKKILIDSQSQILPAEDLLVLHQKENRRFFSCYRSFSRMRVMVDAYLHGGIEGIGTSAEIFEQIEAILEKDKNTYKKDSTFGRQILADYYCPKLIKKVHQSKNTALINLFTKYQDYVPLPRATLFADEAVPEHIAVREKMYDEAINEFLSQVDDKEKALTLVARLQRKIRSNNRQIEQSANVVAILEKQYAKKNLSRDIALIREKAVKDINNSQYPHVPRGCSKDLARRLVSAATQVKLWPKIKHITSPQHVASILDDGLMGRRNLRNNYMTFIPAALGESDREVGDGNMICFGPNRIHVLDSSTDKLEFVFDADAIRREKNPVMAFKSRDLGFGQKDYQTMTIGNLKFSFNQRDPDYRLAESGYTYFIFNWQNTCTQAPSTNSSFLSQPSCLQIYEDVQALDMILSLYPFSYIDKLPAMKRNAIYNEFDILNTDALVATLQDFADKATDTGEFNFYGFYLVPCELMLEINFLRKGSQLWSIKIEDLLRELNNGEENLLDQLKSYAPKLLESNRFIDFLLSKTANEHSRNLLLEFRLAPRHTDLDAH